MYMRQVLCSSISHNVVVPAEFTQKCTVIQVFVKNGNEPVTDNRYQLRTTSVVGRFGKAIRWSFVGFDYRLSGDETESFFETVYRNRDGSGYRLSVGKGDTSIGCRFRFSTFEGRSRIVYRNRVSKPRYVMLLFPLQVCSREYPIRYFRVEFYVIQQELRVGILTQFVDHLY